MICSEVKVAWFLLEAFVEVEPESACPLPQPREMQLAKTNKVFAIEDVAGMRIGSEKELEKRHGRRDIV